MEDRSIKTTLVNGFLDAGKTTYIQDCIFHDFFHKRGTTLILCFEQGETEYDEEALRQFRTETAYYEGGEDITAFCLRCIELHCPDRIFVEMNAMSEALREQLPSRMEIVFSTTLIAAETLELYARNMRQLLQNMIVGADLVTFNRCGDKEQLAPYSQLFRLMNRKATYLWESPMGYHEKAFDIFVPFDLEQSELTLAGSDLVPFILDALSRPEHYEGKKLRFLCQAGVSGEEADMFIAGRTVMTCCLADVQFMGIPCRLPPGQSIRPRSWLDLTAEAVLTHDAYGQKRLTLVPLQLTPAGPPENRILQG